VLTHLVLSSVRLAARLFLENLLDQDHFLEWLLSSFESAQLDTLPIWLLMTRIYWKDLLRYRKRARRLAECLLEKRRLVSLLSCRPHDPSC
jgi:mediator of RNA polymerase II transcription subunit 12